MHIDHFSAVERESKVEMTTVERSKLFTLGHKHTLKDALRKLTCKAYVYVIAGYTFSKQS